MSFDTHVFVRPKCDYPDCPARWGCVEYVEYDWIYDEFDATEEVEESEGWICLYDDDDRPRFFCPQHTIGGWFEEFDPECHPSNVELLDYYRDVLTPQPLPKPECEDTILAVLKGETQ